jgi:hypothetical protein
VLASPEWLARPTALFARGSMLAANQLSAATRRAEALFELDPANQVVLADCAEQCWVVGRHMPSDDPDHLLVSVSPGHKTALAADHLGHGTPPLLVARQWYELAQK